MSEFVVVEGRSHESLFCEGGGDAGGVAGDPAAAPLLGDEGGCAGTTGWIEGYVAGVCRHQYAAFNDFGVGLDYVSLFGAKGAANCVFPHVVEWREWKIVVVSLERQSSPDREKSVGLRE